MGVYPPEALGEEPRALFLERLNLHHIPCELPET